MTSGLYDEPAGGISAFLLFWSPPIMRSLASGMPRTYRLSTRHHQRRVRVASWSASFL